MRANGAPFHNRDLAELVLVVRVPRRAEGACVHLVVDDILANDEVADLLAGQEAAGDAGEDDRRRAEFVDHRRRRAAREDHANVGRTEDDVLAAELSGGEGKDTLLRFNLIGDVFLQLDNLLRHRREDSDALDGRHH